MGLIEKLKKSQEIPIRERLTHTENESYIVDSNLYTSDLKIILSEYLFLNFNEKELLDLIHKVHQYCKNIQDPYYLINILSKSIKSKFNFKLRSRKIKKRFINQLSSLNYDSIIAIFTNSIFDNRNLKKIDDSQLESLENELEELAEIAVENMLKLTGFKGNISKYVYNPANINSLTIWYTKKQFENLDHNLKKLAYLPGGHDKVMAVITIGIALGFFNEDHANYNINTLIVRKYINPSWPEYLKKIAEKAKPIKSSSNKLTKLKNFWSKFFSFNFLIKKIDTETQGQSPEAQKLVAAKKGASIEEINLLYLQSTLEHQKRIRKIKDASKNILEELLNILTSYNPYLKKHLFIETQKSKEWEIFKRKSEGLLEIFNRNIGQGFKLATEREAKRKAELEANPEAEREAVNQKILGELANFLISGSKENKVLLTELFGQEFRTISKIEKVALIIFTALTLARKNSTYYKSLSIIDNYFIKQLREYHDIEVTLPENNLPTNYETAYSNEQTKNVNAARQHLKSAVSEDNLVAVDDKSYIKSSKEKNAIFNKLMKILLDARKKVDRLHLVLWILIAFLARYGFESHVFELLEKKTGTSMIEIFTNTEPFYIGAITFLFLLSRKVNDIKEKIDIEIKNQERPSRLYLDLDGLTKILKYFIEINSIKSLKKDKKLQTIIRDCIIVLLCFSGFQNGLPYAIENGPEIVSRITSSLFDQNQYSTENQNLTEIYKDYPFFETQVQLSEPDKLDQELLNSVELTKIGNVYHLPKNFKLPESNIIGYLPSAFFNNQHTFLEADIMLVTFENVEYVTELNENTHKSEEDELVYLTQNDSVILKAFDGYEIIKIYRKFGNNTIIQRNKYGYLQNEFSTINSGEAIIIVAKKINNQSNNDNNLSVEKNQFTTTDYNPWQLESGKNWAYYKEQAILLNNQLSNDEKLQTLHLDLINEIDSLYNNANKYSYSQTKIKEEYSKIAEKYTELFSKYIEKNRTYSILFEIQNDMKNEPILVNIADQNNSGFYCSVANISFQEFMGSVGIKVVLKPGNFIYFNNNDNFLYKKIGHMNSMVILPNGKTLNTDMTPTNPNPGEDLSVFNHPNWSEEKSDLESLAPVTNAKTENETSSNSESKIKDKLTFSKSKNEDDNFENITEILLTLIIGASISQETTLKIEKYKKSKSTTNRKYKAIKHLEKIFQNNTVVDADVKKSLLHILSYVLEIQNQNSQIKFGPSEPFKTKDYFLDLLAKDAFTFSSYLSNEEDIKTNLEKSKNLNNQITTMEFSHKQILNLKNSLIIVRRELIKNKIEMITSLQKKLVELQTQIKEEKKLIVLDNLTTQQETINKIVAEAEKIKNKITLISAFSQQLDNSLKIFIDV